MSTQDGLPVPRRSALLLALACACGLAQASSDIHGDEAWIDAYMQHQSRQQQAHASSRVAFGQLAKLEGERVRLILKDGRERSGTIQRADHGSATLRSNAHSGYFSFTVRRDEVRGVERMPRP